MPELCSVYVIISFASCLQVYETAQEPIPEEKDSINSMNSLSQEATFINQNFSQQVLQKVWSQQLFLLSRRLQKSKRMFHFWDWFSPVILFSEMCQQVLLFKVPHRSAMSCLQDGKKYEFKEPNPFASENEEVASVAYRYRKWKLDEVRHSVLKFLTWFVVTH